VITVAQEDGSSKAVPAWTEDCFTYHSLTTRLHVLLCPGCVCLSVCLSVSLPCAHTYVISRAYEPHVHVHMLKFKAVELTKV
jgi:hypothetical protein